MDKNLEQAVEQLSKGVAPETVHVLWLTAETLEKTRELSDSYSLEIIDLTPESVERVKKGESTVLQESPVAIDRASLAAVCREILSTLLGKVGKDMDPEVLKMLEGIDWDALVDDHAATLAGTRPQEFLNYIYDNANGADPDTLSRFIFPVLSWALRVFIGNAAKSKAASLDQDSLEDRKYGYKPHCPICGGDPVKRISMARFAASSAAPAALPGTGTASAARTAKRTRRVTSVMSTIRTTWITASTCATTAVRSSRPCSSTRMNLTGLRTSLSS